MAVSSIEWTEMTWNPTTGCDKLTAGCRFCYAEVMTKRLKGMGQEKYKDGFALRMHESALDVPYSWNKPQMVFVNSMSDLFHKDVTIQFIEQVFKVMNDTPQHIYQILTKRADLLARYDYEGRLNWSPNIWMGVSVESVKLYDRIDQLRTTGALTKFLSCEPLIAPLPNMNLDGIHWVIVGGESGHRARPMQLDWALDIKNQCETSNVPFFFKQWGKAEFNVNSDDPTMDKKNPLYAKGGCELNGKIYRQMPDRFNVHATFN